MKYSIMINQRVVADINDQLEKGNKLDLIDCAILDWLVAICTSRDERIAAQRNDGMTWISYSKLISDMPLLGLTAKSSVSKRLNNLAEGGYIRLNTIRQRTYVDYTLKTEKLSYNPDLSTNKPFTTANSYGKTVHHSERNRSPQRTDNNTSIRHRKNKIQESPRRVKSNLNISLSTRISATKDWLAEKDKGQNFDDWFVKNQSRYLQPALNP